MENPISVTVHAVTATPVTLTPITVKTLISMLRYPITGDAVIANSAPTQNEG